MVREKGLRRSPERTEAVMTKTTTNKALRKTEKTTAIKLMATQGKTR